MRGKTGGFSLIEALISLLVLSIGFIGLGQLQSRLWLAAGERHTRGDALLVAANLMEQTRGTLPTATGQPGSLPPVNPKTRTFTTGTSTRNRGQLIDIKTTVSWPTRVGRQTVQLHSSLESNVDLQDTRWLLPGN